MRRYPRARALVAVVATAVVAAGAWIGPLGQTGAVARVATSSSDEPSFDDYAPGVEASGEDQCALPVSARSGAWVCLGDVDQIAESNALMGSLRWDDDTTSGTDGTPDPEAPAVAEGRACSREGCWYLRDAYNSHNDSSGEFGYGDDIIGKSHLVAYHRLNGAQMCTRVTFGANTGLGDIHGIGDLLHGSHYDEGEPVSGQRDERTKPSMRAGREWAPWGSTASSRNYCSYDKGYLNHANVTEFAWSINGYPGYWFMYQKSVVAEDPNDNNIYTYRAATYKFENSADAGHVLD